MRTRKDNGQGSTRKLENGKWECVIQSNYINPKTMKNKRFKRIAETEDKARKAAKMALKNWEKAFLYGQDVKIDKTKTFGKYMEEYIDTEVKDRVAASTYRSYTKHMARLFYKYKISSYQLHMLNKKVFEDYYDEIGRKYAVKTCALTIQLCRQLCDNLVTNSLLEENYARQVTVKKEVKDEYKRDREIDGETGKQIFTIDDIKKFYQAYKDGWGEYGVVAVFMLETGVRPEEFAAITLDSIDKEKRTILIDKARGTRFIDNDKNNKSEVYIKTTKNQKSRIIYLTDLALECVEYMEAKTRLYCNNNYLNLLYPTFRSGKPRSNSSMQTCFNDLMKKYDIDKGTKRTANGLIKGLSLYDLRHSFVSYANTAFGGNPSITALFAGHQQRVDENIYTHANVELLKQVKTPSQLFLNEEEKEDDITEEITEEQELALLKKLLEKYKDKL